MNGILSGLSVLFLGIFLGALGALAFSYPRPLSLLAAVVSIGEGDIELNTSMHLLYGEASTTSIVSLYGTATSSVRSIKIPVMVYHSVRPYIEGESAEQDRYDITPELLEEELRYVKSRGYTTVRFVDVAAYFDKGMPLPEKPIILSFDDGWANEYHYAFPLLQKYQMHGTFFVFTNPIGRKSNWMTWEQIKEMDNAGMEIGGHSRTHPILTRIMTDEELDKEILGGKEILEAHLGHSINVFAYPFGETDERVIAAVRRAGYMLARTIRSGVWNDPDHRLEFHGTLASDTFSDFERLLNKE